MAKRQQKKSKRRPYYSGRRYNVLVKVDDDWYPNLDDDQIRISVIELAQYTQESPMVVRICAWGGDDYGLEIDTEVFSEQGRNSKYRELIKYANTLKELEPINSEFLKSEGWGPA